MTYSMRLALNFRLSALFQLISATDGFDSVGQFRRHSLPCFMDSLSPSYSFPLPTCLKCLIWDKLGAGSYHASTTITAQVIKGFKGGRKGKYYMTFAIAMCIQQHRMFTFNFYSSFLPLVTEQLISATD